MTAYERSTTNVAYMFGCVCVGGWHLSLSVLDFEWASTGLSGQGVLPSGIVTRGHVLTMPLLTALLTTPSGRQIRDDLEAYLAPQLAAEGLGLADVQVP